MRSSHLTSRGPQCSGPEPVQPVIRIDSSHPCDTPTASQVQANLSDVRAITMAFAAHDRNES
jgi:hypothetical protein